MNNSNWSRELEGGAGRWPVPAQSLGESAWVVSPWRSLLDYHSAPGSNFKKKFFFFPQEVVCRKLREVSPGLGPHLGVLDPSSVILEIWGVSGYYWDLSSTTSQTHQE